MNDHLVVAAVRGQGVPANQEHELVVSWVDLGVHDVEVRDLELNAISLPEQLLVDSLILQADVELVHLSRLLVRLLILFHRVRVVVFAPLDVLGLQLFDILDELSLVLDLLLHLIVH